LIERARIPSRRSRRREPISAETVDTMERRLELHVFPYIGERDVRLLTARELLEVLRRIESRETYDLAHRVRSICSRVLRYARATGRQCEDVASDLVGSLAPVESEHMAAIVEPARIGALRRSIASLARDAGCSRNCEIRNGRCLDVALPRRCGQWGMPARRCAGTASRQ